MSNDKQETIPMGKTVMVLVSLQPQGEAQDPRMGVLLCLGSCDGVCASGVSLV